MARIRKRLRHKGYIDGRAGREAASSELVYAVGYAKGTQARVRAEGGELRRDSRKVPSSMGWAHSLQGAKPP